jgi:hypothetical protein
MEAYLPPNEPSRVSLHEHPLLATFSDRTEENEQIRKNVIDIITTTPMKQVVRGIHSVEKKYMGQLMRQSKGKVDVELALKIIKEEIAKRFEFEPAGPSSLKVKPREKKLET